MPVAAFAAAATAVGAVVTSGNASHAADTAANAQTAASNATIAENAREFDLINSNGAPARNISNASLSALGGAFGLPGYGAPTMTGGAATLQQPHAGQVQSDPGVSMTSPGAGADGATTNRTIVDHTAAGAAAGPSMTGGPDWDAYIAAYPDIQSYITGLEAKGQIGPNGVYQTPEQFAAAQYSQTGQSEGRTVPTTAPSSSTMTGPTTAGGYVAPPGYTDPTAPNGYDAGARPTPAATPAQFTPGTLNVGLDAYQQSPDYNFRLQQGNNALDHTAASMGGVMSGARVKAADRYNQDYATTDYNNWRDYTTNQYNTNNQFGNLLSQEAIGQSNTDRARSDGLYQDDRSFLTNQYDTRTGQLMTLAGFGAGANNTSANAATSFAASDAAARGNAATATGNAAINGANATTSTFNNLVTTGAYLGGQYMTANPSSYYGVNPSSVGYGGITGQTYTGPITGAWGG